MQKTKKNPHKMPATSTAKAVHERQTQANMHIIWDSRLLLTPDKAIPPAQHCCTNHTTTNSKCCNWNSIKPAGLLLVGQTTKP